MRGELSHGQVEFVWVAFKICVVVVMEMKRKGYATENYARLMGELEAVAFTNVTNQTPTELVRGLMANKDDAHNRTQMLENRTTGVRLMWQMMLHGYTTAVTSMQRRSKATLGKITAELEAMSNYVPAQKSAEGSSSTKRRRVEPESLKKAFGDRKVSTSKWDRVAALAFQAKTIAESTDSDEGFDEAMSLLHQSIKSLPEYYVKPFDVHELWLEAEATIPDMLKKKTFS
ncbi:hypothetical protein BC832DRAFT_363536 [Gaertneriomyces semiglobifer]|nr:hypothetical protein BC832DRAFT_363536 [Gaertneriomyces semiglobifer]